ncbi:MAG: hypothetical protein Q9159_001018 [Coniocarpon cinnabarinum]
MAAAVAPSTPVAPGHYATTPAPNRQLPFDARTSQPNRTLSFGDGGRGPSAERSSVSYLNVNGQAVNPMAPPPPAPAKSMTLIERAAKTVNDKLDEAGRFPAIDFYLSQGSSGDYDISQSSAWAPFQRVKTHDIPDQVLEQYNNAQFSTSLGLFAEIGHAWVAIDNSLYLWDYTHPNPEVLGYEEAQSGITCVRLVKPRPGVFVPTITHLIVIATTMDIQLVGVACTDNDLGSKTVNLYRTDMRTQTNRTSIDCIVGSSKTGRIFFAGRSDNEIYELTYQQEDSWFRPKCAKVCQTRSGARSYIPSNPFSGRGSEHVVDLVVDDSRNTLYALSTGSAIRAFTLRGSSDLPMSLERTFSSILNELVHRTPQNEVINAQSPIVSLSPLSSQEASRLWLMATLSTGVRIYFSGVSGSYISTTGDGLSSLQIHHVRFPPPDATSTAVSTQALQPTGQQNAPPAGQLATTSKALVRTTRSFRYQPGYFTCFVEKGNRGEAEVFFTAPDSARIASMRQDPSQYNNFPESGQWINMSMPLEVGLSTTPFAASPRPEGFGNELATQFDQGVAELAILTNSSITTYRRRRLVDVFASTIRLGGFTEGLGGEITSFAHRYGRPETIASALAVACGQASDVGPDARVVKITDNQVLQAARETFIAHGGRPEADQNAAFESGIPTIDQIRPSPRHEGLALYLSRLLRSVWRANILIEGKEQSGALKITPAVSAPKLQGIQRDLIRLQEFLNNNKSSIAGLSGPDALGRAATKQDEVSLQAEHRALNSLLRLTGDVVEGMSFVLVLFEESVVDIILSLPESSREIAKGMTFERLFCTSQGKDLAKELVKAIVNRNIASGMNIDSVTDALRRRCGSFCSADDSVIFKAQEQLKRASDPATSNETSRNLLNQSLQLLTKVAGSLTLEQLQWAAIQYINQKFFGGAVQLILTVANEQDRGNSALAWFRDGRPGQDAREAAFVNRQNCYDMIHDVINAVDAAAVSAPTMIDGQYTPEARRHREAYEVVNTSQDELFHINLYNWYLSNGWADRLLEVRSPFVVSFLSREASFSLERADLLAKYFAHHHEFVEAARVQFSLAKSTDFAIPLEARITYLSYARANASTKPIGLGGSGYSSLNGSHPRANRHQLLREISDLLDLASIQADVLSRIRIDIRVSAERIPSIVAKLDGPILSLDTLFNDYADAGSYHDICLAIYQSADYRNPADIKQTWDALFKSIDHEVREARERSAAGEPVPPSAILGDDVDPSGALPWEMVGLKVQSVGARVGRSEAIFPLPTIVQLLYTYLINTEQNLPTSASRNAAHGLPPAAVNFVPSLFLIPPLANLFDPQQLVSALERLFYIREAPFRGKSSRRMVTRDLIYTIRIFYEQTRHASDGVMGGPEAAQGMAELLGEVLSSDVAREEGIGKEGGDLLRAVRASMGGLQ